MLSAAAGSGGINFDRCTTNANSGSYCIIHGGRKKSLKCVHPKSVVKFHEEEGVSLGIDMFIECLFVIYLHDLPPEQHVAIKVINLHQ